MKHFKSIALIFSFIIMMTSCQGPVENNLITIENSFSIELPSFLSKTTDLNADAALEYANMFKEFYVIVIDDTISVAHDILVEYELTDIYSSDLNGYTDLVLDGFVEELVIIEEPVVQDVKINGLDSKLISLSANIDSYEIFYYYGIVEGENSYYQIMAWTLLENMDKYKGDMDDIIKSFVDL